MAPGLAWIFAVSEFATRFPRWVARRQTHYGQVMRRSPFHAWAVQQRGYARFHTEPLWMLGLYLEWYGRAAMRLAKETFGEKL